MASNGPKFKLGLVQLTVGSCKEDNVAKAVSMVTKAATEGAQLVILPEMFTSPLELSVLSKNSEPIPGPTSEALAKAAKDHGIFIIGGSIPEKGSDGKIYNSCVIFDPEGNVIGVHRKIHLFDVDIPDKVTVQESKIISPGNHLTCFDTPYCKVGVAICYDARFAELAQLYAQKGCKLLVYPAAVNRKTGEAQWELLLRMRAVDNQMFVAMVSPARDESASYVVWGHSLVASPWGKVIAEADHTETIVYADIDLTEVDQVRTSIPLNTQRRPDIYRVVDMRSMKA